MVRKVLKKILDEVVKDRPQLNMGSDSAREWLADRIVTRLEVSNEEVCGSKKTSAGLPSHAITSVSTERNG